MALLTERNFLPPVYDNLFVERQKTYKRKYIKLANLEHQ